MVPVVRALVSAGIPVVGHIGLTPQSISSLGGYRVQGKQHRQALGLLDDALALQTAGCLMIVLEAMPAVVAAAITERLVIPTIGIGAGAGCSGQVLVQNDMLGVFDGFVPKFCKRYADIQSMAVDAIAEYRLEVKSGQFPSVTHTYPMADKVAPGQEAVDEEALFLAALADRDK
eukprot:Partr_v1_DN25257_c3_g1_i2_m16774 putative 3-methyl-2-oxobutanoate hydroxymethyltransferase